KIKQNGRPCRSVSELLFPVRQEGSDMSVNGTGGNEAVSGNGFRPWHQPRGGGRPSAGAPFAPPIGGWAGGGPRLFGAPGLRPRTGGRLSRRQERALRAGAANSDSDLGEPVGRPVQRQPLGSHVLPAPSRS